MATSSEAEPPDSESSLPEMTELDRLLHLWGSHPAARRGLLIVIVGLVIYLDRSGVGPDVSVPFFAAAAGVLPVLLLAAFIHARDIVSASADRLKEEQRLISDMQGSINRSMYQHLSLAFQLKTGIPSETKQKLEELEELRDRLDETEAGLEEDEESIQEFGERWAALLVCIVELAAAGEAAALVALASPSPSLPPAILNGVVMALVLLLLTWAVAVLIRFSTQVTSE